MSSRTPHRSMSPRFHLLLVFALLFLSGLQLAHQSDLHAHEDNGSCEICLFAGNVHDGIAFAPIQLTPPQTNYYYRLPLYQSTRLPRHGLLHPTQRGPPTLSIG